MDHDPLWERNASRKTAKNFSRRILGPESYSNPLDPLLDELFYNEPTKGSARNGTARSNGNASARMISTTGRHGARQPKSSRAPPVRANPLPVLEKRLPFNYRGDVFTQRGTYCEASLYLSRLPSKWGKLSSSSSTSNMLRTQSGGSCGAKYRVGVKLAPVAHQDGSHGRPLSREGLKTPNIKSQRKSQFALAIESMAANPSLRSTLLNDNVIPSIMTLCRTRDMATLNACIAALCHLSHESEGRAAILSNGSFSLIPTHIITLNLDKRVMYNCLAILTNLTMEDSFESVFVREKGLEGLMKHRKSCDQAEHMCMVALFNLTCPNYSYPRVDDVIHALVDHARISVDHHVVAYGSSSNTTTTTTTNNNNNNNGSSASTLPATTTNNSSNSNLNGNTLPSHHGGTAGYDVDMLGRAIYNMCSTRMNQSKFGENETMNTLRNLMQHSSEYVCFQTLCAFWQLADVVSCRKAMIRFDCVRAIVHEMARLHHNDESVQCALAVLLKLCVDPVAREQMAHANALEILGELAQRSVSSTGKADINSASSPQLTVQTSASDLLRTTASMPTITAIPTSTTAATSTNTTRIRDQDIQVMVFRLMALILAMESNISLVEERFFTFLVEFEHLNFPQVLSKYVLFCLASIFSWNNLNGSCNIGFDSSDATKGKSSTVHRMHSHRSLHERSNSHNNLLQMGGGHANHDEVGVITSTEDPRLLRGGSVLSLDDLLDEPTLLEKVYRHVDYNHFAVDSVETQMQMVLLYNLSFGYSKTELATFAASRLQQIGTTIAASSLGAPVATGPTSPLHPSDSVATAIAPTAGAGPNTSAEKHHTSHTISLIVMTLFSLCQDYDAHVVLWDSANLLHLMENLTTQSDEATRLVLFELICLLFDAKQLDESCLIEIVKSLFPLIVAHCNSRSSQLRARCSACLARFASIRESRVMMAKNGLINALAVLASEQDAQTLRFCVHAYSCLSRDQVLCATLINNGIVKSLTFLAAAPEEAVRRACAMTLCNLSTSEENIGALVKHGAFRALLVISCVKSNDAETRRICMKSIMNLLRLPSNLPQMCHDGLLWAFAMFARDVEVRDYEIMADAFEALAFYPLTREGIIKPAILTALLPILASHAASVPTKVRLLKGIANALQLPVTATILMSHGVLDLLCDLSEEHVKEMQLPLQQQQQQSDPQTKLEEPSNNPGETASTPSQDHVAAGSSSISPIKLPSMPSSMCLVSSLAAVANYCATISLLTTQQGTSMSSSSSTAASTPRQELPAIVSQILLLLFQHCPEHEMDFALHPKFLATLELLLGHASGTKDLGASDTVRFCSFLLLFMTCQPTCCEVLAKKSFTFKRFVPELIIRAPSEPSRVLLRCLYHVSCHEEYLMDIYGVECLQAITSSVTRHWENKEAMKLCASLLRNFATNEACHVLMINQHGLGLFKKLFEMEDAKVKEDISVALCNLFLGKVNSTELLSNAILHVLLWLTANPALENLLLCSATIRKLAIPPGNIEMLVDGGVISHIVPLMQSCHVMGVKQNCVATLCLLARKSGIAMILASYGVISAVLSLLETATKENALDAQLEGMCVDLLTILAEHVRSDVPEESKLSSTLYRLIENDDRTDRTQQQSAFWQNDRSFLNRDGTKQTELQQTKLAKHLVQNLQDLKLVKGTLFPVATTGYSVDFSNHGSTQLDLRELEPLFPEIDTLGDSGEPTHSGTNNSSSDASTASNPVAAEREHTEPEFPQKRSNFASISTFLPPKMHSKIREPFHPLAAPLHHANSSSSGPPHINTLILGTSSTPPSPSASNSPGSSASLLSLANGTSGGSSRNLSPVTRVNSTTSLADGSRSRALSAVVEVEE